MTAIDLGVPQIGPGERIGAGGFGTVYRAEQIGLARPVAVKILSAVVDRDVELRRFERERKALASVADHPNIVSLFGWGLTPDRRPYLVMEYLPGGTLASLVREGPLKTDLAVSMTTKLARALAAAHERGVLHRDVKPENVLVSAFGEPVLCDFGIARVAEGGTTHTSSVSASVSHAAPEVLEGDPPTEAGDVWALMSTLHTLLAGRAPFCGPTDHDSMAAMITRVLTKPPPDLRPLGVPDDLASLVEAGLAKDPAQRLRRAAVVADQLEALMATHGWTHQAVPVVDAAPGPLPGWDAAADEALLPVDATVVREPLPTPAKATVVRGLAPPAEEVSPAASRRHLGLVTVGALVMAVLAGVVVVVLMTGRDRSPVLSSSTGEVSATTTVTTAPAVVPVTTTSASTSTSTPTTTAARVVDPVRTSPDDAYCVVGVASNDVLFVRAQPSASAQAVGAIPPGSCSVLRGSGAVQVGGYEWWEVVYQRPDSTVVKGWSNSHFLQGP